jgi:phage-related protein
MNVRSWYETFLITDIDGLDDADVRDERVSLPVQHGEAAYDSYYGGRTITLTGKIRTYSLQRMRDYIQAMRLAFSDLQEHPLIIRSAPTAQIVQIYCKKYQKLVIHESQQNFKHERDFQVSLRASSPFFLGYIEHFAPIAVPTSPASTTITNLGNFGARPRFIIAGPITNPMIVNTTTGKQMLFNGTIAAGQVWTVDTRKMTVVDQAGVNKFSALDVTSDWIDLQSGPNTIQISGTGLAGGTSVQVYWSDTWV